VARYLGNPQPTEPMPADRSNASPPSNHPDVRILVPIAALVIAALGLLAGSLWFASVAQDNLARQHEHQLINHAIATVRRQTSLEAKDYSYWDDAVQHLVLGLDPDWADGNVGAYVYDTFGFEYSFVLDGSDRTVYGQIDGARSTADAFAVLGPALARLIARARAASLAADQTPEPSVGLLKAGDNIVVAAVSPLLPQAGSHLQLPPGPRSVLVFVKPLGADFLRQIETDFSLQRVRIGAPPTGASTARIPLVSPTGQDLATLSWIPCRPGRKLLVLLSPALLVALAVFLGFAGLALRNVRRAAAAIRDGETRFRDIAEASSDWLWETDAELRVAFVSERFTTITGTGPRAIVGRPLTEVLHPAEDRERWDRHLADLAARQPFRGLLCCLDEGVGRAHTLRVAGKPIVDANGRFCGYRGAATDITAELHAQTQAQFLARHDPFTGLPNRLLLQERLQQALAECRRRRGIAAVLCLDLDGFKEVNDRLGHAAGDLLLKICAGRLSACVREIDSVARLGGDEFAVLQVGIEDLTDVEGLADRLLVEIARPFDLGGQEALVTTSIGVALIAADGDNPEALLQSADIALYRAKSEGGNRCRFFEAGMDARLRERNALEAGLRSALRRGELELYYQPLINLHDARITGIEALVRWHHPTRGLIEPHEFIELAEQTGLIMPIGEWVLNTACAQVAAWPDVRIAVNLSAVQFRHADLVSAVRSALDRSGLAPCRLELEVTESILLEDPQESLLMLLQFKDLGVRIAIDDFGTGRSSLGHLRAFPFDKIKIDRSLVRDLDQGCDAEAIIKAVVTLGNGLGTEVCAEGVERVDQLAQLADDGCDEVQGYLFCKPMPAADAQTFIERAAKGSLFADLIVDRPGRRA
jgi:diguanylate cyclase (GGDEF)-like protein/PAS domain S-box-containing protein